MKIEKIPTEDFEIKIVMSEKEGEQLLTDLEIYDENYSREPATTDLQRALKEHLR